jgi:hypothetical protein
VVVAAVAEVARLAVGAVVLAVAVAVAAVVIVVVAAAAVEVAGVGGILAAGVVKQQLSGPLHEC